MIRLATKYDIHKIVDAARIMHAEAPHYFNIPFVAEDLYNFMKRIMSSANNPVFIKEIDGQIAGMVGMIVVPYMFNFSHGYMSDIGVYVPPDRRGMGILLHLIRKIEDWAESGAHNMTLHEIRFGESAGVMPEIYGAIMKKLGYIECGRLYKKELKK